MLQFHKKNISDVTQRTHFSFANENEQKSVILQCEFSTQENRVNFGPRIY